MPNKACKECDYGVNLLGDGMSEYVHKECELGYTQNPASFEAVKHSLANNAEVCKFIKAKLYYKYQTKEGIKLGTD